MLTRNLYQSPPGSATQRSILNSPKPNYADRYFRKNTPGAETSYKLSMMRTDTYFNNSPTSNLHSGKSNYPSTPKDMQLNQRRSIIRTENSIGTHGTSRNSSRNRSIGKVEKRSKSPFGMGSRNNLNLISNNHLSHNDLQIQANPKITNQIVSPQHKRIFGSPFVSSSGAQNNVFDNNLTEEISSIKQVQSQRRLFSSKEESQFLIQQNSSRLNNSKLSGTSSVLPESLKVQPIQSLFLCINCCQYFLYPEKSSHANYCRFTGSLQQVHYKLQRLSQVLNVVGERKPNPYTQSLSKKIKRFLQGKADIQDIQIMEGFMRNSKVDVGLDWEQLFLVINKLAESVSSIRENKPFWMFCS